MVAILSILQRKFFNNNFSHPYSIITFLLSSLFILLLCSFSISIGKAATQGSFGNTSSGSVDVNIVIGRTIVIRGLRDFNFGVWNSGDGTLTDNDNVCIGKNDFGGPYAIHASGNGDGFDPAAFTLSNGTNQIYYNVYWNDATGTSGNVQLSPGLILYGQTGSFFSFLFNLFGFCVANANVEVEIPDTELQAASGGNYSGTLTLLVIPD